MDFFAKLGVTLAVILVATIFFWASDAAGVALSGFISRRRCRRKCGECGWEVVRREVLREEPRVLFEGPALITYYDERCRCLKCGAIHRKQSREIEFIKP